MEPQLAALDRPPEVVLEVDPLDRLVATSTARTGRSGGTASAFARTIAISASRSISPGVARPGRPTAMPSDALMNHSRPPIGNGARSSCADPLGDPPRLLDVDDRVEDDPELVAAEAGDRVARAAGAPTSRWPTAARSRSPTAWPRLSLMTLNRSRSSRMTAIGSASVRLGRPGRGAIRVGQELAVRAGRWSGRRGRRAGRRRTAGRCPGRSRRAGRSGPGRAISRGPNERSVVPEASPMTPTTSSRPKSAARRGRPRTWRSAGPASGRRTRRSRRPRAARPSR